jgi:Recombination directionality factor-like
MPLRYFICPDNLKIKVTDCLKEGGCRMGTRCATRSYLQLIKSERPWTGRPSTTQLISGTMSAFLKLTKEYAISPDARAFMIHGTKGHNQLENSDDEYSLLEEKFNDEQTEITGIADVLEIENGKSVLCDYKTSGSFKVAKALGFYVDEEPTGEVFKSGKRKGEPKTRKVLKRSNEKMDRYEWELQLNKYRLEYEKRGFKPDHLKIMCIVRDGNTYIARSRGVFRNIYYFDIAILPDDEIINYFAQKKAALETALASGKWHEICTAKENWDGLKCENYCEVAEFCKYGKYLKREREVEDMAIKGLSEIRRLPRLGKIRLGIKKSKQTDKGMVDYPAEVDYFIIDPATPSELENKAIIEDSVKLYGDKPKSLKIMFPVANPETYFPQFYKRYGSGTLLQCKGDGETAVCSGEEFTKDLEIIGKNEMGMPKAKCKGKECPYYIAKKCTEVGTLQVLLPDLKGAGVWQITTGSYNSIVNLNSCIEYITAMCGRAHMIPLTLERREQEISHNGKKTKHYILHINMDFKLSDLQKHALIDPTRMLIELPPVEAEKEDILFEENPVINAEIIEPPPVMQPEEPKKEEKPIINKKPVKGRDKGMAITCPEKGEKLRPKTDCNTCDKNLTCPAWE